MNKNMNGNVMNEADKILLDGLRLVADASDDVWALVEAEVAKAGGVRNVTGQARLEIERAVAKARTLVEKHPGHADQSVHGSGKKRGVKPATKPDGIGAGSEGDRAVDQAVSLLGSADKIPSAGRADHSKASIASERKAMGTATKQQAIDRSKEHQVAFEVASAEARGYQKRAEMQNKAGNGKEAQAEYKMQDVWNKSAGISVSLASAWGSVAMALGASEASMVDKAVTLVGKHGTHDQSAHGGKKGKAPTGNPESAPSGGGGNSQAVAYKTTHDAGVGASKKMAEHANTMTREIAGHGAKSGSRDSVELSSITDDLDAVMADVADLPAGKSRAIEAVRNHRTRLQQTALTAKGLDNPRSTDSAIKAIRQTATELKLLEATITEAWNGVPDLSQG